MPIILDEKELEKLRKSRRRAKRAQPVRSSKKVENEFKRQISELWMKVLLPTTQRIKEMVKAGASPYEIAIVIEDALRWANTEYEMASYNLIDRWRGSLDKETRWALNDSLRKAIAYIRLNYHSDININKVAEEVGISERYLRNLFSQYLNLSPLDYLNQIRINKAVELLRNTEMSIKEVCFQCGFQSPQYFSRIFKQQMGVSPRDVAK